MGILSKSPVPFNGKIRRNGWMETNRVEIKKTETKRMEPDLKLINMETVEVEQIEWLFYPFIPFGKVTIIQGDPGEGKTTMVL